MIEDPISPPAVFISYAWTSDAHIDAVLQLATRLREDGVNAIIDKWDLEIGQNAHAFMERMVTDEDVEKVIIISNRVYVEKANSKTGGVGTEAQIISPEVYENVNQEKFAVVLFELDDDKKPILPVFARGRIYVNLAEEAGYEQEYERLIRWIFGRPLHRKPPVGRMPAHLLDSESKASATHSAFSRAITAIKDSRPSSLGLLRDYTVSLMAELERGRLISGGKADFDEDVIGAAKEFQPFISEVRELVRWISRNKDGIEFISEIHRILEKVQNLTRPPKGTRQFHDWDFDNYRLLVHNIYLHVTEVLIDEDRFDLADNLLKRRIRIDTSMNHDRFTEDFSAVNPYLRSMDYRNQRLKLNRISVYADIISDICKAVSANLNLLMQADLLLFLRDAAQAIRGPGSLAPSWHPILLVFLEDEWRPFPLFASAEAFGVALGLAQFLGLSNPGEIKQLIEEIYNRKWVPRRVHFGVELKRLTNSDRIGVYT